MEVDQRSQSRAVQTTPGRTPRAKRTLRALGVCALILGAMVCWTTALGAVALEVATLAPFPAHWLRDSGAGSTKLLDRDGAPLRVTLDAREGRTFWVARDAISERVVQATVASEDHRFWEHSGVDPVAVLRAAYLNASHGRIYSGASTVTMQLVKQLAPGPRARTFERKLYEAALALRLERHLGKDAILTQYLNRIPYGNGTHGVEAASQLYLRKPARDLNAAEAAFLVALPRSPSGYNPYRRLDRALQRQRHILGLMHKRGYLDDAQLAEALDTPIRVAPRAWPFEAPHFVDLVQSRHSSLLEHRPRQLQTTLDGRLQRDLEDRVHAHLAPLRGAGAQQAAVVVLDNASSELLAMVGSDGWEDTTRQGRYNAALAPRHPGATLAPLLYALAFESGELNPAEPLADTHQAWVLAAGERLYPRNPDGQFLGPVSARRALAEGRTVPMLRVLERLDGPWVVDRLADMGLTDLPARLDWDRALGVMRSTSRVNLLQLTTAYAALARGGPWRPPVTLRAIQDADADQLADLQPAPTLDAFTPTAAHLVTHILSDEGVRDQLDGPNGPLALPFPAATFTTARGQDGDLWALGFTSEVTVGVWLGRFDGRPLGHLNPRADVAPLLADALKLAMRDRAPALFDAPATVAHAHVCALSGKLAGPDCAHTSEEVFDADDVPTSTCAWHVAVPVDRRNQLRAHSGCASEHITWTRRVALPPEYARWARRHNLRSLTRQVSPECPILGAEVVEDLHGWDASLLIPDVFAPKPAAPHTVARREGTEAQVFTQAHAPRYY